MRVLRRNGMNERPNGSANRTGIHEMTVITCGQREFDFRVGSFSTELGCPRNVRSAPVSDRTADIAGGPVRANTSHGTHPELEATVAAESATDVA
jgi:hypothetical protein